MPIAVPLAVIQKLLGLESIVLVQLKMHPRQQLYGLLWYAGVHVCGCPRHAWWKAVLWPIAWNGLAKFPVVRVGVRVQFFGANEKEIGNKLIAMSMQLAMEDR